MFTIYNNNICATHYNKRTQRIVRCTCLQGVYNLGENKTSPQMTVRQNRVRAVSQALLQPSQFMSQPKAEEESERFAVLKWAGGNLQKANSNLT